MNLPFCTVMVNSRINRRNFLLFKTALLPKILFCKICTWNRMVFPFAFFAESKITIKVMEHPGNKSKLTI